MKKRETLGSRLGFILLSAGCAIGLGNVWRFPYITGKNGGAGFVLIYLFFLILLGLPVMTVEFSIGRASRQNIGLSLKTLEKPGSKWHLYGPAAVAGNYLLLMFYTTIAGWILYYFFSASTGAFEGIDSNGIGAFFSDLTADPMKQISWMIIITLLSSSIVAIGLQKGVEKITKVMMAALLSIVLILTVHSFTLPGAAAGLKFYLLPDFDALQEAGIGTVMYEALGQAFFTLSVGIGSMSIFGSYIDDGHTLTGESVRIIALDTFVAFTSGLIIFPACFSYDVSVGQGPSLLFITLPNIFSQMAGGRIWASLFFLFMSFAALSTVIAVFENIVSYYIDVRNWTRRKACIVNFIALTVLSLPCILGFNAWSAFKPFGEGSCVLDLEDFVVSNFLLPLGGLCFALYCTRRFGWGWTKFVDEANAGTGPRLPTGRAGALLHAYCAYVLPVVILAVFVLGLLAKFKVLTW